MAGASPSRAAASPRPTFGRASWCGCSTSPCRPPVPAISSGQRAGCRRTQRSFATGCLKNVAATNDRATLGVRSCIDARRCINTRPDPKLEDAAGRVVDEVEVAEIGDELQRGAGAGAAAGIDARADIGAVHREEDQRLAPHRLDHFRRRLERLLAGLEVRALLEEVLGPQAAEQLLAAD